MRKYCKFIINGFSIEELNTLIKDLKEEFPSAADFFINSGYTEEYGTVYNTACIEYQRDETEEETKKRLDSDDAAKRRRLADFREQERTLKQEGLL